MTRSRLTWRGSLCILLPIAAIWVGFAPPSLAQRALSVELGPPNVHLNGTPGEQLQGTLTIRNTAEKPVTLTVLRSDFVLDPKGTIRTLQASTLPTSVASWLTIGSQALSIQAGGTTTFRYSVSVPESATPGTHWAAILFRTDLSQPDTQQSDNVIGVRYAAQLAYIVYVDIGRLTQDGSITSVSLLTGPDASGVGPTVRVSYQNTGNAYARLKGRLELRSLDGKLIKTVEIAETPVLPGELRYLDVPLDAKVEPGSYVVTAILDNGSQKLVAGQAQLTVPKLP